MKTKFKFNEPAVKHSTGLTTGMFNDDLTFTFEAKDVHVTDPKEIDKMLAALDLAVLKFKQSAKKLLKSSSE